MIDLQGDTELAAGLHAVADGLVHLDGPAMAAGRLLVGDAQGRAPRKTGRLRASIAARAEGNGVTVGTDVRYGWPVHQGVPSRNIGARPFLAGALRAQQDRILAGYTNAVQELLNRAV